MKILLILFVLFFSTSVFADKQSTSYNDEQNITEINLIIEEDDECSITTSQIETEIKFVLSNSNIKVKNSLDNIKYYLWVQPTNFNIELNKNICVINVNYHFYSITSDFRKILLWRENKMQVSEYPWKKYFLDDVNATIKTFVIWINENR
tara:strand:- start:85 stop:534 length:450 start_codon:yes stop_codon:yes gene_type:complete